MHVRTTREQVPLAGGRVVRESEKVRTLLDLLFEEYNQKWTITKSGEVFRSLILRS